MASVNPHTRELVFKLVFYGPGLGGKTTTLQYIHAATKPEHRGKMVSLATPTDRTLYFDFLPIRVPRVRGMAVRLQLFTVPGQVYYSATRKLVLTGADGIVFVADSQSARIDANQESLEDLNANLAEHGRALSQMPHTFQWNKRDLDDVVAEEELDRRFNLFSAPAIGTTATEGEGVFEGLEQITKLVMEAYRSELPDRREIIMLLDDEASGIANAIRGLAEDPRAGGGAGSGDVAGAAAASAQPVSRAETATPAGDAVTVDRPRALESEGVGARIAAQAMAAARSKSAHDAHGHLQPTLSPSSSAGTAFSMAEFWPEADRDAVRKCEHLLAARDALGAIMACDVLLTRVFASAAGLSGAADAPRDPGLVCLLLGLEGRRYVRFRALVRAARQSEDVSFRDALDCFAFLVEARRSMTLVAVGHLGS